MSQNLQNFVKFQKFQLENLVDFEKCCKTHIFLQKSEPIQPKTSNILPNFCQPTLSDVGCIVPASAAGGPRRRERAGQPALEPCDPSHGYAARRCSRYLLDRICQNVDKMLAVLGCIGADICN